MTDLDATFDKAVAHIGSSTISASNDVKLELYANYKIATTAVVPQNAKLNRPGMFDFAGRAKYDAWAKCGTELEKAHPAKHSDELVLLAKARYIEVAKQYFAFDEEEEPTVSQKVVEAREKTADELLDEDEEDSPPQVSGSTGGMSVSKMSLQTLGIDGDDSSWPLQDLSSRGDVQGIEALRPSALQLNALDSNGFAAIHLAADKEVVRLLISMGADPNRPDSEGMTALDTAEAVENNEIVEMLKEYAS